MSLQRCEGPNLEAVLEEVRSRWGDEAKIVEANRVRRGGVAGFFARESFEVVVDADQVDETAEESYVSVEPLAFTDQLLGLAERVSDDEEADVEAAASTEHVDFAALLSSIQEHVEPATVPAPTSEPTPAPVPAPAPAPVASVPAPALPAAASSAFPAVPAPPSMSPQEQALVRAGLPEDLARAAGTGGDTTRRLLELLEQVPRPTTLPRGRGSVVAVVGTRESALALSRELSAELGLDEESIMLASARYRGFAVPPERCIDTAELASEERRSWRRRAHPTVVAVECIPGGSAEWGRRMLDALEPTMIWATAEATRKPEDLAHWAEQAGGFDALAVTGLDETVSPASVLRSGIPVGRLDGRPATPALWAALLAGRLVA